MEYFSTKYGLVTDGDPTTENGQLFLALYILLLQRADRELYGEELARCYQLMSAQLYNSRVEGEPGLYHRNTDLTDRRIMSHDNMIGIMCWSSFFGTYHCKLIWSYLLRHFGLYDNTQGKTEQLSKYLPYSPQSMFIFGLAAESALAYVFLPFFIINLIVGCAKRREDTSGKILDYITMQSLSNHFIIRVCNKYYEYRMKKQYGNDYVKELITIYFGSSNSRQFPINKIFGIGY